MQFLFLGSMNDESGCPNMQIRIPVKCVGSDCPDQIRFPSDGKWYISDAKIMHKDEKKNVRFELQKNGLYNKFKGKTQLCPENWTWNTTTGVWYGIEGSESKISQKEYFSQINTFRI